MSVEIMVVERWERLGVGVGSWEGMKARGSIAHRKGK